MSLFDYWGGKRTINIDYRDPRTAYEKAHAGVTRGFKGCKEIDIFINNKAITGTNLNEVFFHEMLHAFLMLYFPNVNMSGKAQERLAIQFGKVAEAFINYGTIINERKTKKKPLTSK